MECLLGILKNRWHYLLPQIETHSGEDIKRACKCTCILDNIILDYQQGYEEAMDRWKDIDFSDMDPEVMGDIDPDVWFTTVMTRLDEVEVA